VHLHIGRTDVPASIETYGHVCKPPVQQFSTLHNTAALRSLALASGLFLASGLGVPEVSMALTQSQGFVFRSCVLLLAKTAGRQVL
jgi:hypothetical protein